MSTAYEARVVPEQLLQVLLVQLTRRVWFLCSIRRPCGMFSPAPTCGARQCPSGYGVHTSGLTGPCFLPESSACRVQAYIADVSPPSQRAINLGMLQGLSIGGTQPITHISAASAVAAGAPLLELSLPMPQLPL